ncbi:MAG: carboxylating nicotinate-nucleotide diphosphorylase, partial [Planctomycetota bacterium]
MTTGISRLDALARELFATGLPRRLFEIARDEDLGPGGEPGDVTSEAVVAPDAELTAAVRAREPMTIAGLAMLEQLRDVVAPEVGIERIASDGDAATQDTTLATISGRAIDVLALERPMLNLLGRLSGIAALTRRVVDLIAGTGCDVCDTRKTTPGLRVLEKYAVACGGGTPHRLGLHDALLIKDNHLAAMGSPTGDALTRSLTELCARARESHADLKFVQVECDTLAQAKAVLAVPAGVIDLLLLDNMPPDVLREAVAMRDDLQPSVKLEASGGISFDTVRAIAETGVDRVSMGALTHGAVSVDVGLDALD